MEWTLNEYSADAPTLRTQVFVQKEQHATATSTATTQGATNARITGINVDSSATVGNVVSTTAATKEEQREQRCGSWCWLDVAVVARTKPFPTVLTQESVLHLGSGIVTLITHESLRIAPGEIGVGVIGMVA